MKRILFIFLFLQVFAFGFAQNKKRHVQVYTVHPDILSKAVTSYGGKLNYNYTKFCDEVAKSATEIDEEGAVLFSFENNTQRENFIKEFTKRKTNDGKNYIVPNAEKNYFEWIDIDDESAYISKEVLINGNAIIDAPDNAVFLVGYGSLQGVNDPNHRWMHFDYGETGNGLENHPGLEIYLPLLQLKSVEIKQTIVTERRDENLENEHQIHWKWTYPIDRENANPDIRLGFRPIAIEYESNGIFKLITPKVVDGANFRIYQRQRMGQDIKKNDPMGAWADSTLIYAGRPDTVRMSDVIERKVPGKHYTIDMEMYEMSHDGIYNKRRFQVYDGRSRMPLKFADFTFSLTQINHRLFHKEVISKSFSEERDSRLPFEQGKAQLNPADIEGQKLLKEAVNFALSYATGAEFFNQSFEIEGFASPEGNEQANERLAYNRAVYLRNEINKEIARSNIANQQISVKQPATVQPWTVVADAIDRLGPDYKEEAQKVRDICAETSGMKAQEARIRTLPFYKELIEDSILPTLRFSRIRASYTINRELSPSEVVERFQSDPTSYITSTSTPPAYEYYHLMNHYKDDFKTLEPIARMAHYRFKDDNKYIRKNSNWAGREWTLAAYHLARCQVDRSDFESAERTLRPYIFDSIVIADWDLRKKTSDFLPSKNTMFSRAPMNEPAVALLYIETLCGSGKYQEALNVFKHAMDTVKYKEVGLFIRTTANPRRLFEDSNLRNEMAATSTWNSVIVNAALCGEEENPSRTYCVNEALKTMLRDTTVFKDDDPRVHYLKARLLFDQLCQKEPKKNRLPVCNGPELFKLEFSPAEMSARLSMSAELMKTFMLDESFLYDELRWDGYFPMGVYLKAKEVWENNDPTKLRLHPSDAEFVKKYAKPHKPKMQATKEK